jgi:hypothetical protein
LTCPSEKYGSQLGSLFPIYGKLKKIMFKTTNQVILRDMFIQYGIGTFPLPPEALLQAAGTVSGKNGLITPCPFALHIGVLHHQPLKLS